MLCEEIVGFPRFFIAVRITACHINVSDIHLAFSWKYHMFLKILNAGRLGVKEGKERFFSNAVLKLYASKGGR